MPTANETVILTLFQVSVCAACWLALLQLDGNYDTELSISHLVSDDEFRNFLDMIPLLGSSNRSAHALFAFVGVCPVHALNQGGSGLLTGVEGYKNNLCHKEYFGLFLKNPAGVAVWPRYGGVPLPFAQRPEVGKDRNRLAKGTMAEDKTYSMEAGNSTEASDSSKRKEAKELDVTRNVRMAKHRSRRANHTPSRIARTT